MKDLGLLLKDGEIQAAPKEQPGDAVHDESTPYPMVTLGEAAGRQAEEAKANTGETADQSDAPPAAKEAEKPIVVQKPDVESLVKATVDRVIAERTPAPVKEEKAPESKASPVPDADAAYEAGLGEDERADIEFARMAEARMPEKYRDFAKKQIAFYKKLDAYVENAKKENPDRTFNGNDSDLDSFIAENKPRINPHDQLKIVRMQATEDAAASSRAEIAKVTDGLKEQERIKEILPKIRQAAAATADTLQAAFGDPRKPNEVASNAPDPRTEEELIVDQTISRAKEVGWDDAVKQDPVHGAIVKAVLDTTARRAAEFSAMIHGVTQFKSENPDHAWLARFVDTQTRVVQSLGPKATHRQGADGSVQTFLPRDQFIAALAKDPETSSKHWTFDDGQVVAMIVENSRQDIPRLIKTEHERLTAAGYRWEKPGEKKKELPKQANPAPAKATATPSKQAPKAAPSISHGSSSSNGVMAGPSMFSDREKELLGIGSV